MNRVLDFICIIMILSGVWSFFDASQAATIFSFGVVIFIIAMIFYFVQKYLDDLR